jgi:hypothetical protein
VVIGTFFVNPKDELDHHPETLSRVSNFFLIHSNLEDEIPFKGGSLVTPQNSIFWNVTKIH